jgi:hypothetical protein
MSGTSKELFRTTPTSGFLATSAGHREALYTRCAFTPFAMQIRVLPLWGWQVP